MPLARYIAPFPSDEVTASWRPLGENAISESPTPSLLFEHETVGPEAVDAEPVGGGERDPAAVWAVPRLPHRAAGGGVDRRAWSERSGVEHLRRRVAVAPASARIHRGCYQRAVRAVLRLHAPACTQGHGETTPGSGVEHTNAAETPDQQPATVGRKSHRAHTETVERWPHRHDAKPVGAQVPLFEVTHIR